MHRDKPDVKQLEAYAGRASMVTADFRRRKGASADALAGYDRAVAHYEKAVAADPILRDAAETAITFATASKARIELEAGDVEKAAADIIASFERRPQSAGDKDGADITP